MGDVIDLLKSNQEKMADKGELAFIVCPVCNDQDVGYFPIVGFSARDKRPFIHSLMCISDKCMGNTIIDVENGYVSEEARFVE